MGADLYRLQTIGVRMVAAVPFLTAILPAVRQAAHRPW
jgi:hypothetical protein